MEELDILKKNWNKEIHPKVTTEGIYKMILKKSSSSVKWIFIISILEFGIGLISGLFFTPQGIEGFYLPSWLESLITTATFLIAIIYSYKFYKNHKTINATSSVKGLLSTIIKTRKTVKQYVLINLCLAAVIVVFILSFTLTAPMGVNNEIAFQLTNVKDYFILGFVILFVTAIIIGICLLVYFLLYGLLMRKLNKNYKELKQLDL